MNMATRNTPSATRRAFARLRSGLLITGQALLLTFLAATAWAYVWLADTLINAPEPETRCFTAADHTHRTIAGSSHDE